MFASIRIVLEHVYMRLHPGLKFHFGQGNFIISVRMSPNKVKLSSVQISRGVVQFNQSEISNHAEFSM